LLPEDTGTSHPVKSSAIFQAPAYTCENQQLSVIQRFSLLPSSLRTLLNITYVQLYNLMVAYAVVELVLHFLRIRIDARFLDRCHSSFTEQRQIRSEFLKLTACYPHQSGIHALEADKHTCDQDECSELSQTKIECRLANSISLLLS
jgi:hypothetical protein